MGIVALVAIGLLVGIVVANAPSDRPAPQTTEQQRPR
jgi:hypothetical protein